MEILDLLNEESVSGALSGRASLEIRREVLLRMFEKVSRYLKYDSNFFVCSQTYITRIMVTIKKRAGVIPYSFSSSKALLSSLLSCSFYLLDPRTISRVAIIEMT